MSSSNTFTHSISRSFRKLFTKKSAKYAHNEAQNISLRNGCSDSGISLVNSDNSTWERVPLYIPKFENTQDTQAFRDIEATSSLHTSTEHNRWSNKPGTNMVQTNLVPKESHIGSKIFDQLCTDFNGLTPVGRSPILKEQRNCERCTATSKSLRKRCLCEVERTQNSTLDDCKPKKPRFITGSLLKRKKVTPEGQVHPSRKMGKRSGGSGFIGPLFSRKNMFGNKSGSKSNEKHTQVHEQSMEDLSSPESLAKFERKLQKVESFERMIVDPEYRNETIRLELTPDILT